MVNGSAVHAVEDLDDADGAVAEAVGVLPLATHAIIPNILYAFKVVDVRDE